VKMLPKKEQGLRSQGLRSQGAAAEGKADDGANSLAHHADDGGESASNLLRRLRSEGTATQRASPSATRRPRTRRAVEQPAWDSTGSQKLKHKWDESGSAWTIMPSKGSGVMNRHNTTRQFVESLRSYSSTSNARRRAAQQRMSLLEALSGDPDLSATIRRGMPPSAVRQISNSDMAFAKALFAHIDAGSSGAIDAEELKFFLEEKLAESFSESQIRAVMERIDDNTSAEGEIQLRDFTAFANMVF